MKIASTLIFAAVATLAQATDAPCTNEACTSLCNATPSCMSTLFEPETAQCYTFSCVLNNYSRPSKYLGYEKPGATYPCPADQPIPGEPQNPPPVAQPTANVDVPAPEPTTAAPTNPAPTTADSTPGGKGEPSSLTTAARPPATDGSGNSPTTGSQSSPTGSTGGSGGSGSGDAGSGEGSDPAAPTIVLDGSAIKAMAPGSLFVAIGLAMVLF